MCDDRLTQIWSREHGACSTRISGRVGVGGLGRWYAAADGVAGKRWWRSVGIGWRRWWTVVDPGGGGGGERQLAMEVGGVKG